MNVVEAVRRKIIDAVATAFAVDGFTRDDVPELRAIARAEAARHGASVTSRELDRLVRLGVPRAARI
ncbi:hypothetical protein [Patulibacter sp.]|uniref:hypothetical protein n=1 Tax=Patulibacter sp. TaxID=1912859 RepID=UPI0027265F88|nr:hypothetical protein [Patulibacter sp.]MDO9409690.1 hypothetical protein [Patulibacter sp.]